MRNATVPVSDSRRVIARAFDYASAYDLRAAREVLERHLGGRILQTNPLIMQVNTRRHVSVFEYGSLVFFNFETDECNDIIEKLKACAQRPNKIIGRDEFTLHLSSRQKKPEGTDELHVKEFNRDTLLLVAAVLSRSVAVEYYETIVANALARLEQTIDALASQGRIPRRETDISKQVGFAMLVEHELAYNISAFDDPEIVWNGGAPIHRLYKDLKREFDLDDRIKVIQQKVSLISRWSTFVISRLEAYRSRMLEWIIIVLIVSEILLVVFGKM